MKKLAIVLSVVMVMALAAPAFAAELKFSGSMGNWIEYKKANGLTNPGAWSGGTSLKLNSSIAVPGAWVEFKGEMETSRTFPNDWDNSSKLNPTQGLGLGKANITITGPFRTGGQDLKMIIGDYQNTLRPNSPWVKGFSLSQIKLGDSVTATMNWVAANTSIVRLDKSGDQLRGYLDVESTAGVITHKGSVTVVPNDKVDVTAAYWNNAKDYKFSSNVKATDMISLYGELESNENYNVRASTGTLTEFPFDPTVTAGYRKAGAATGYYVSSEMKINPINAFVSYDDIDEKTILVGGTGAIYGHGKADKAVDPFVELVSDDGGKINKSKATGVVGIYQKDPNNKTFQLAARYDLASLVNLNLDANTKVEARANIINDLNTGSITKNMVGLVASTKVSAAGFDNVGLDAAFTTDLQANESYYKLGATYNAPNGIGFTAGYGNDSAPSGYRGYDGQLFVKASKTINF